MHYRPEVAHLSHELALESDLSVQAVYFWLMDVGRAMGMNPRRLAFRACPGKIVLASDPDNYRLEEVRQSRPASRDDGAAAYWEDRILARQEAYMD